MATRQPSPFFDLFFLSAHLSLSLFLRSSSSSSSQTTPNSAGIVDLGIHDADCAPSHGRRGTSGFYLFASAAESIGAAHDAGARGAAQVALLLAGGVAACAALVRFGFWLGRRAAR